MAPALYFLRWNMTPGEKRLIFGWMAILTLLLVGLVVGPCVGNLSWDGKIRWPGVVAPAKVTAVAYVYEGKESSVPPPVAAAIAKLNASGVVATSVDDDVLTRAGKIPTQYTAVVPAARKTGLPCLVVTRSDGSVTPLPSPATESQVLEAAK